MYQMLSEVTIHSNVWKKKVYRESAPLSVLQGFAYISGLKQIYVSRTQ